MFYNGVYFPSVLPMRARSKNDDVKEDEFRTREEQVELFFRHEFEEYCRANFVSDGSLLNVVTTLHGVMVSVNAAGMARHRAKPSLKATTKRQRIYTSENYLVRYREDVHRYEAIKLLGDDEWLDVKKVRKAFQRICWDKMYFRLSGGEKGGNWEPASLPTVQLSNVEMDNGFSTVALTATVKDSEQQEHTLACLLSNGLLMADIDAKVTPWKETRGLLRTADCVFRLEKEGEKLKAFTRI